MRSPGSPDVAIIVCVPRGRILSSSCFIVMICCTAVALVHTIAKPLPLIPMTYSMATALFYPISIAAPKSRVTRIAAAPVGCTPAPLHRAIYVSWEDEKEREKERGLDLSFVVHAT